VNRLLREAAGSAAKLDVFTVTSGRSDLVIVKIGGSSDVVNGKIRAMIKT